MQHHNDLSTTMQHSSQLSTAKRDYQYQRSYHFQHIRTHGHYSLSTNFKMSWNLMGVRKFNSNYSQLRGDNLFENFDETRFDETRAVRERYSNSYAIQQLCMCQEKFDLKQQ